MLYWDQEVSQKYTVDMMPRTVNMECYKEKIEVAIKVIQKSKLNQDLNRLVDSQIKILRLINHSNIVKCYEILEDQTSIYIVMQLCEEGDLQSKIDKDGALSEVQALPIIKDVFKGLTYLSEINVIHRDIKVANVFMRKNIPKIADFGFAIHNKAKKQFHDISIGSPIYMSPQGIKHNVYGPKTDIWAFGIFIYQLLHGKTPYSHCTKQKQLQYNISSPLNWNSFKASLSYLVKDLMLKCLEVNYQKRITFQKLKNHELFIDLFQDIKLSSKNQVIHSDKHSGRICIPNSPNLIDLYWTKPQRRAKKQIGFMTPKFTRLDSPQAKQRFKDYCQRLQIELSMNLPVKNYQKIFQNKMKEKLKGQFDDRNLKGHKITGSDFNDDHYGHKTYVDNFLRKPIQKEQFHSLSSNNLKNTQTSKYERFNQDSKGLNHLNSVRKNKVRNGISSREHSLVNVQFAAKNVDCYMYLIHFSRLLYKLAINLQSKPYLWQIRDIISCFSLKILYQIVDKIQHACSKQLRQKGMRLHDSLSVSLVQIQQTALKYITQYEAQMQTTDIDLQFSIKLANAKLQTELNAILHKQIKSNRPQCHQSIKLMYSGWVYLLHFKHILTDYFLSGQPQRCWQDQKLKNAVKFIEQDIEASKSVMKIETCLKLKQIIQNRQY